jgi:hypothetical protein
MPKRIRFIWFDGGTLPFGAKLVTRPSRWGNPFHPDVPGDPASHAAAVAKFRAWVMAPEQDQLRAAARRELAGHDLACECKIGLPCHADVWLEIANGNEDLRS